MKFKTGDIVKASINGVPFVYHYGVIVILSDGVKVVHNSPSRKNEHGGNILVDSLEKWKLSRKIINIQKTRITEDKI